MVWKVLQQLGQLGTGEEISPLENKRIRFSNWVLMVALLLSLGYLPYYLSTEEIVTITVHLLTSCMFVVGLWLNSRGFYTSARFFAIVFSTINLVVISLTQGYATGEHLGLPLVVLFAFLMFDRSQWRLRLLGVCFGVLGSLLLFGLEFMAFSDPDSAIRVYGVSLMVLMLCMAVLAYYFDHFTVNEIQQVSLEARKDLKAILDNSTDAYLVLDAEAYRIEMHNPVAAQLLGRTGELDLTGKSLFGYLPERSRERFRQLLRVSSTQLRQLELFLDAAEHTWVQVSAYRISTREGDRTVVRITDQTLQKRHADHLERARQQAEDATQAKSAFLAGMSHEIRTPLNAIIGMAALLKDTQQPPDQREMVDIIHSSGKSLMLLINDILDLSKLESGALELEVKAFSLEACIERSLTLIGHQAQEKGLRLTYYMEPDVPLQIVGDEVRLSQIFLNLLSNAVKFTHQGEISVFVQVDDTQKGRDMLKATVADTGIGIQGKNLKRIFTAFSQEDTSTTRKFGGTGLGLAICHQLVERMGGKIQVESVPSEGSSFSFTFRGSPAMAGSRPLPRIKGASLVDLTHTTERVLVKGWLRRLGVAEKETNAQIRIVDLEELVHGRKQISGESGTIICKNLEEVLPEEWSHLPIVNRPLTFDRFVGAMLQASGEEEPNVLGGEILGQSGAKEDLKILIVEDNLVNQKVISRILNKIGYQNISIAADGQAAVHAWKKEDPDLILMDIHMPIKDGVSATKEIRQEQGYRQPVILALSASASLEERNRCLAAGMEGFLAKPVEIQTLKESLQSYQNQAYESRQPT